MEILKQLFNDCVHEYNNQLCFMDLVPISVDPSNPIVASVPLKLILCLYLFDILLEMVTSQDHHESLNLMLQQVMVIFRV